MGWCLQVARWLGCLRAWWSTLGVWLVKSGLVELVTKSRLVKVMTKLGSRACLLVADSHLH